MFKNSEEKLWKAISSNPVWPSELIENTKDLNYKSINFTSRRDGQEVNVLFEENGDLAKAIYNFDENNLLQHCYMIEPQVKSIIYDRQQIINKLKVDIEIAKLSIDKNNTNIHPHLYKDMMS